MQAPPIPARSARLIVSDEVMAALGDAAGAATPLDGVTLNGYAPRRRTWRLE